MTYYTILYALLWSITIAWVQSGQHKAHIDYSSKQNKKKGITPHKTSMNGGSTWIKILQLNGELSSYGANKFVYGLEWPQSLAFQLFPTGKEPLTLSEQYIW